MSEATSTSTQGQPADSQQGDTAEQIKHAVFPPIGDPNEDARREQARGIPGFEPEQQQGQDTGQDTDRRVQELQQERDKLERELREERERQRRYNDLLQQSALQTQAQPQQPAPQGDDGFDLSQLPDPVNAPQDFAKAIHEQARREIQQHTQQQQTQQTREQQLNALWDRFQREHQDLANFDLEVGGVAEQEMKRLQTAGYDPIQFATANPDDFLRQVADRTRNYLTERGVSPGQQSGQSGQQAPEAQAAAAPGAAPRTAGIDGGEPPRTPRGGQNGQQSQGLSFVEELAQDQARHGLI